MKREYRVRKHPEFDRIIKGGKKIKSAHFALYYLPSLKGSEHGRIGIAVSKANGNAVKRVRAKRQVRAMLGKVKAYNRAVDLIVVIRPNYKDGAYHEYEEELLHNLSQIKDE